MTFDAKEIGHRIKRRRVELHISPTKAALDLNVSLDHLRKLEVGLRSPSLELLLLLSDYFGVTTDFLLKGSQAQAALHKELNVIIERLVELERTL